MTSTTKTTRRRRDLVEERMQAAWAIASEAGDYAQLAKLREAFEGRGLGGGPILVRKLTQAQAERIAQVDGVEDSMLLAAGPSWVLVQDAEALGDLVERIGCEDFLAEAIDLAEGSVMSDMSDAQAEFLARSIKRSLKVLGRKLRAHLRHVEALAEQFAG